MTRKEAIEEIKRWTPILLNSGQCTEKTSEAQDMAISALSEELSEDGTLTVHVSDGSKVTRVFVMGDNIFGGLYYPDSAKTDTAKPEEGAELIDRRQIKWYGCDHEGHIKGINCDTADCSKCFFATVEHDEIMSLPVYRIPDSAENKGDLISRQAVERLVWEYLRKGTDENIAFYEHFLDLPSVENKGDTVSREWIPVGGIKDVPKAGTYWVTKHYGDNDYVIKLKWYCNCWCDECDRPFYYTELEGITAYMPYIPEPYKGESEDK